MMMISHHRMGDNGNGPDRVIEYILTSETKSTSLRTSDTNVGTTNSTNGYPAACYCTC